MRRLALALLMLGIGLPVAAQQVSLNGRLGSDSALLVIDGQVRTLRVGQAQHGVKLLQVGDESALVEVQGQRLQLRLGAEPVAQKPSSGPQRIVMRVASGGHFLAEGSINGNAVRFMVDTGATAVSLGLSDAQRLGISLRGGQPIRMQTANGIVQGYRVLLDRVRVGNVEVYGVEAAIGGPSLPYVLLGNSFLTRFHMTRDHELMTLEKRF